MRNVIIKTIKINAEQVKKLEALGYKVKVWIV